MKKILKYLTILLLLSIIIIGFVLEQLDKRKANTTLQERNVEQSKELFFDQNTNSDNYTNPEKGSNSKIIISGVKLNNFYKTSKTINKQGDIELVKNKNYTILYLVKFNQFLISILDPSFTTVRKQAEKEFLKILDIDKPSACKLNTTISTPAFVNPEAAGTNYKLSFCE